MTETVTAARTLRQVAREIRATWPKVFYGALPYLTAMAALDKATDPYGCDTGSEIVQRFLSNAATWRGADARRIKAELKLSLKGA